MTREQYQRYVQSFQDAYERARQLDGTVFYKYESYSKPPFEYQYSRPRCETETTEPLSRMPYGDAGIIPSPIVLSSEEYQID